MSQSCYTVISFAPVQGFIEKSRKLRDLYGSSFLLSYLSWIICKTAESPKYGCTVISPALINVIQGTPNQIIIQGDFPEADARQALDMGWKCITTTCKEWIEETLKEQWNFQYWNRVWKLWNNHSWEFFWVQGQGTISDVRQLLNNRKYQRDWTGINWQGESSTLSGADSVAFPGMNKIANPCEYNYQLQKTEISKFYQQLEDKLGESFIDSTEELSIPELIKRIITHEKISKNLISKVKQYFQGTGINFQELFKNIEQLARDLNPDTFKELNRHENKCWTAWFMGDGDKAGDYLRTYPERTHDFSKEMRKWGKQFQENPPKNCRVVYAGGDDFLGIFYDIKEGKQLPPKQCIQQFINFKTQIKLNLIGHIYIMMLPC
jgi:CRISPR-associated protein Cmr2